jgi:hypothetical protein
MHENKALFYRYFFATFQRKLGILISDLYFYSIKMPTNINPKWWENMLENHKLFLKGFWKFYEIFFVVFFLKNKIYNI